MDVYVKHRWLVYVYEEMMSTPFWRRTGQEFLTDWEAKEWIDQIPAKPGTKFRIVEVLWTPEIQLIEEVTK